MSTQDLKDAVSGKAVSPVAEMQKALQRMVPQFKNALPPHQDVNRLIRLAITAYSSTRKLQQCTPVSFGRAVLNAAQMGLEIGVLGQGWIVPYKTTATFVPGWQGLVDLVSRSGRATAWTGAVFAGDEFDYEQGSNPYIKHRPGGEDDPEKLLFVYAVGRVKGAEYPIIEVWPIEKVRKHRNKYNKVGMDHYSYRDWEMYARKIPLLQVLKYMPKSVELQNAITASEGADTGMSGTIIDGQYVTDDDGDAGNGEITGNRGQGAMQGAQASNAARAASTVNTETGETESLLDTVKRICAAAVATQDTDTAWIRLDDARVILPDMLENKQLAVIEINAAEASLKGRVKA